MISKRKRNTILVYCMASMIMLLAFVSNVTEVTTQLKTNSKKVVANNNYVETDELSYGLVAIEASSCIEKTEDAKDVTEQKEQKEVKEEEKKEEKKVSSKKTSENKKSTSKQKTATTKKTVTKTTTQKANNTTKKTTSKKKVSTTKTTTKVPSNIELGKKIASYAKNFIGNPYKMGGTSLTNGTDCSGFTMSVFKHFGINIPRTASSQANVGVKVSFNSLQPGDLVFYSNGSSRISHVAIYIGNGKIVHARTPKEGIGINSVNIMIKVTARRVVK